MKKYVAEFIGTFFLVLTVVMTANDPRMALWAPFAVGGMYLAMVYAGGPVSGAHFNPAITLAALLSRKIERGDAFYYLVNQLVAGGLAAAIGVFLYDCGGGIPIEARVNEQAMCAVMGEFFGTFALAYVLLSSSGKPAQETPQPNGIAAGFALLAVIYAFGGLSGGAFNPAVAFGASVAGLFAWEDFWAYCIGPALGAAAAATVFQLLQKPEE